MMSLICNMLPRFLIVFLPRSKCLLISWLQSLFTVILESKEIKSVTVSTVSLSICHEVIGLDTMIPVFWMLSFKPTFSLFSFILTKRLFRSSLLSAIRVASVYLRLLTFLLAILIPACDLSSPAFRMMYCAYKLNKHVAAKSLQSCLTLCDPRDGSLPGSPIPGILQARTLEWVTISFSNEWKWKVKVKLLRLSTWKLHSRVRLLGIPWTAVYQAPPSMGFSRQEYWSGVPLPSP